MRAISNPGEIRIPVRLLSEAIARKQTKALRVLASAKLLGHRAEISPLLDSLDIHPKTGKRIIDKIVGAGWAGTDGISLFPRSWRRLSMNKRGGLYITTQPNNLKKFESQCFTVALRRKLRKANPRLIKGKTLPTGSPTRSTNYLAEAFGKDEKQKNLMSVRRFERLKAQAQRYKFLKSEQEFTVIGQADAINSFRKHGKMPCYVRGAFTVVPEVSKITIKL